MLNGSRVSAVCFLLLACLGIAQAQDATQAQPKPRRFLMWKITSPSATVYLFGSIHVGDKDLYPLPQGVESAFSSAKILAVEVNSKNVDQAKELQLLQKYGFYAGEDNLSKHLSKEAATALDEFCKLHEVPRAGMEQLKPWVLASSLAAMSWQQAGEDPALGIDVHFVNEVHEPQRIDELETMDSQISIFGAATDEEQQSMLVSVLKMGNKAGEMIKRIQAAYVSGDPATLQNIMEEETDLGSKSLTKKLLDDRNVAMTAKIGGYLKGKDPTFVVVGAAHIVGPRGIAKLLRDQGYKVDQVTLEAR